MLNNFSNCPFCKERVIRTDHFNLVCESCHNSTVSLEHYFEQSVPESFHSYENGKCTECSTKFPQTHEQYEYLRIGEYSVEFFPDRVIIRANFADRTAKMENCALKYEDVDTEEKLKSVLESYLIL